MGDIRDKMQVCPNCGGVGWTAEHDPRDPHINGVCTNCPAQLWCDLCEGTGIVWIDSIKEKQIKEKYQDDKLPF